MQDLILQYGVYLVALLIFAGELGVPTGIPAEVAMLLAGSYAIRSGTNLAWGVALVSAGDFVGTLLLHIVARTGGVHLLRKLHIRREADAEITERWRQRLGGRDALAVFVTRLLPLVRMWATIGSGLIPIRLTSFVVGALPASVIWTGVPLVAGFVLRGSVRRFEEQYTGFSHIGLIVLPGISAGMAALWWTSRGKSPSGKLRRGRLVAGLAACAGAIYYVVRIAIRSDQAASHGSTFLPLPILVSWLALLMLAAIGLSAVAYEDIRAARAEIVSDHPAPRLEVMSAVAWIFLVIALGATMTWMEFRYPAL